LAPRVQLCSEQRAARSYVSWPLFDVRVFGTAALECSSSESTWTRHGGRFFLRGFYIGAGLLGRRPSGCRNSALRRQMTSFWRRPTAPEIFILSSRVGSATSYLTPRAAVA